MTYSHNAEADFAASELARIFASDPGVCYAAAGAPAGLSASASYEPSSAPWPLADGVVSLLESGTGARRDVAVEYKRRQEGVHGLLTAMGQAHAYLDKGYNGAVIVIPSVYTTLNAPGEYVKGVLDRVSQARAIGVFHYNAPDTASAAPFAGRLHCVRPLEVATGASAAARSASSGPKTQWVHMREGSTTRDAFFRFLQTAKRLSSGDNPTQPDLPSGLRKAVARLAPSKTPAEYLANTADDKFLTQVWRAFWFEWVATRTVLTPWRLDGSVYVTPNACTRVDRDDGQGKSQIFEGRANGLKETIVGLLNTGHVTEDEAWELFAEGIAARPGMQNKQGVRHRAHSYREDLDSALLQLKWIANDGLPTDYGYRYMTLCERYGGANSQAAKEYVGASLLQTGRYASFLHYVHRLSESKFADDPLAFTRETSTGKPVFNEESYADYLAYLEAQLTDELKVMRKVSGRSRPRQRTPFQVELTLLRHNGFVSQDRYRLGVGLPIDWERVIEALNVEL